jgi:lactoylglutathione lyase
MLKSIDHVGTRCSDPRKVVEFYTEVLNAEFCRAVTGTRISSGDDTPHLNVFLRLEDGSMLDFMDAPLFKPAIPDPNTPPWVRHIAMQVGSEADVLEIKRRVEARGLKVDGPINRPRNFAVYFYDPFGNRLECTYEREKLPEAERQQAWSILEKWEARKATGEFNGR